MPLTAIVMQCARTFLQRGWPLIQCATESRLLPRLRCIALILLSMLPAVTSHAWDATGHRLSAYLAWEQLSDTEQSYAIDTLQAHPRFRQDFQNAMPDNIRRLSSMEQQRWMFGQAAVWPDLVRSFQGRLRTTYHRPEWHWIDGAWVRGDATLQGNVYLDTPALMPITGEANIMREEDADNVLTALEFALYQLRHETRPDLRAIALCWLLHLVGDIHQPFHSGALVSARLFPDGDRGGNSIRVADSNLHAVWDRALRSPGLMPLFHELRDESAPADFVPEFAPEQWLIESRIILHEYGYPQSVRNAIRRAEQSGNRRFVINLPPRYQQQMQDIATQRIMTTAWRSAALISELTEHQRPPHSH